MLTLLPAICRNQVSLVQEILKSGIDTYSSEFDHRQQLQNSLYLAVWYGYSEVVRLLLDAGVSPESQVILISEATPLTEQQKEAT